MNKIPSITIGFIALPLHLNFASLTPSRIGYRELRRRLFLCMLDLAGTIRREALRPARKSFFFFSYENILDAVR